MVVRPGDTIDSISRQFGVSASAIMQANAISGEASIQPGQRLIIPRYSNVAGAPYGVTAAHPPALTRVASNAPMVPIASGAGGASRTPAAAMTGGIHVVAPGETLIALGRLYGKSPAEIARANNLPPDVRIKVGQRLVIPGARPVPARAAARARVLKPPTPTPVSRTAENVPAPRPHLIQPTARPTPPAPKLVSADPAVNARVAAPTADPPNETAEAPKETVEPASSFRWPVRGRVISGFGPKTGGPPNDGINLAVPEGTSIKAAEDGVVAYAGNELKGYGNLVLVRHNNGFVTAYAHASELMVKRGDQVKRGQIIARSGQTGTVSSPQLHFEIRKGSTPVDPMQYLSGT